MSTPEYLRETAMMIREGAKAARPGPYFLEAVQDEDGTWEPDAGTTLMAPPTPEETAVGSWEPCEIGNLYPQATLVHVARFATPEVAHAVASLLDQEADVMEAYAQYLDADADGETFYRPPNMWATEIARAYRRERT